MERRIPVEYMERRVPVEIWNGAHIEKYATARPGGDMERRIANAIGINECSKSPENRCFQRHEKLF